jgi:nitrogen fixation protein NifU and related proteins
MFSEKLLEHFRNPKNTGELEPPALTVEVSNPACGDVLRLSARIHEGVIADARYLARGCTASIATGSALAEWLPGKSVAELASLKAAAIEALVDGLTNETRHASVLCLDGVKTLLRAARRE